MTAFVTGTRRLQQLCRAPVVSTPRAAVSRLGCTLLHTVSTSAAGSRTFVSTSSASFSDSNVDDFADSWMDAESDSVINDKIKKGKSRTFSGSAEGKGDRLNSNFKKPDRPPKKAAPTLLRRVLHIRRVARVNSGGKVRSVSVLAVVGNQNGSAGYGMGRALDAGSAMRKALTLAEKNMVHFARLDNRTIFANLDHTYHNTNLQLRTAYPGYGLIVNRNIHEVCRCIGITDLSGKVRGSLNPMNVIKATFDALSKQKSPTDIAQIRGKKVVDIQMAYYGTKF
ncbi:hypothetical protein BASA50_004190 [Batrachochytrium salamandrivorans]|uniref:S5 DRBM domain-containing protein n=1 Tax=Batrachochytrium salamandrivorans TaxID=1357716 RepID=A0ABQ8FGC4_9FUNG|nr:hypothetical protein BASA60_008652 [Batrachochytrium salamandrivorans]KAH6580178.1 hypothetical protein BASA61_009809 [Batrachochytrium salamandrivorans]KAH6597846.1 hypothetical protein BASA50_004190 [Batrachochytrium salamandrivorans]KAH9269365.1 hypothetical protein BASA83_008591 [Batrachochytrium salamandrivorans]